MKTILSLLALAALLTGCTHHYGCTGSPASKERADCEAHHKRELDSFNKKQKGEPLSLKGALKDDDPLCYKNPKAGEKPCAIN